MKKIFILFMMVGLGADVFAQAPDTLWTRTYGGSNHDMARAIQQTTDGGYIVAGHTRLPEPNYADSYLVRTNSQGDTMWTRTYGGSFDNEFYSVQQTTDSGYIVAGYSFSMVSGSNDLCIGKVSGQGDMLWTHNFGGISDDVALSVKQTADGGYIAAGYTYSFGAGSYDTYVVRTSSLGDTLWTRTYGGIGYDDARSVQQTADGGYILAGSTSFSDADDRDFYLVKLDDQGNTLWSRSYGGSNDDDAESVQQTADGGYILVGHTGTSSYASQDFYVIKTNDQGDTLWSRTYGGNNEDMAYSGYETTDGGYIFAGTTRSFGAGYNDFYLVKTNSQGDTLWTQTNGDSQTDYSYSVQQTSDGGYVVAGASYSLSSGSYDFYVVKTEPDPCFSATPAAPEVVITTLGEDAHLTWAVVDSSIGGCAVSVERYLVFYSPTTDGPFYYHGWTSDTSYTHLEIVNFSATQFYLVVAVDSPVAAAALLVVGADMGVVLDALRPHPLTPSP